MDTGKSALGLEGNVAAALSYPIGIIAIICAIMDKENRFVRFHAFQSLLMHAAYIVLAILVWIIGIILFVLGMAASVATNSGAASGLTTLIFFVIWMALILSYVGGLIFAAVKAYGGNYFKLPVLGNLAEKFVGN